MKTSKISKLMELPLPSLTEQRKKAYRPSLRKIKAMYRLINEEIFKNKLSMPEIQLVKRSKYWGLCMGKGRWGRPYPTGSYCIIKITNKFYSQQWMIATLAHEMVHQYQWDIYSGKRKKQGKLPIMSHGPSFYAWRNKLAKFGITLKTTFSKQKWFTYQKLDKC
jgi:hypothetical protein